MNRGSLQIHRKSSSRAHQLWYPAQTILTYEFNVLTTYQQAAANSLLVDLRSSTTTDKAVQHLKAPQWLQNLFSSQKWWELTFETFGEVLHRFAKNCKTYALYRLILTRWTKTDAIFRLSLPENRYKLQGPKNLYTGELFLNVTMMTS